MFLVVIGSLAVGAGTTYLLVRPVPGPAASASEAASSDDGPALAALAMPASATDVPAAPTLVHSPALQGDPAGEYVIGPADSTSASGTAEKALDMAAILVGPADTIDAMRRATYRLTLGGPQRRSVTATVDATLGVVVRDDESGAEQGRIAGVCYLKLHGAIVGCKRGDALLLQALHWMHRGQLVRPLLEKPWRIASSGAIQTDNRLQNTISIEVPGAAPSGEVQSVATLDPRGRRLLRLSINTVAEPGEVPAGELPRREGEASPAPKGGPDPGQERRSEGDRTADVRQVELEFSEPRSFLGLQFSGTIRVRTPLDGTLGQDVTVHVVDVTRGGEVPSTPPAPALPKGLITGSRLASTAMVFPLEGSGQVLAKLDKITPKPLLQAVIDQFEVIEAYGALGGEPSEGVQLWLIPRWPSALTSPGVQPHVASIPVALRVVGRFSKVPMEQLNAEAAKVLAEVEGAGHKPAGGQRTTATYLDRDGVTGRITVFVQVPVE